VLLAAALAVGVLVGLLSGLTGIGGGVLMVPFLYVLYARLAVPASDATLLAHATSLAVIVPTALRGLIGYRGLGLVRWRQALTLAAAAAVSAALSVRLAVHVPAHALRTGFGLFLLVVAANLLRHRDRPGVRPLEGRASTLYAALLGVPIGALSAFLGVGGGVVATIGMYYVLRIGFDAVAPTSLAVIVVTAAAGSLSYLFTAPAEALPFGWVVGHVDFGHALPLAAGSVAAAPLGVRLNRRIPVATLRRLFSVFLLLIGLDIVWENVLR
jgi:uncharacterized membrane protein YfcA